MWAPEKQAPAAGKFWKISVSSKVTFAVDMGTEILYNVNTSGVYHAGLERRRTMRIIISPAKKMRVNSDDFAAEQLPRFLDRTE